MTVSCIYSFKKDHPGEKKMHKIWHEWSPQILKKWRFIARALCLIEFGAYREFKSAARHSQANKMDMNLSATAVIVLLDTNICESQRWVWMCILFSVQDSPRGRRLRLSDWGEKQGHCGEVRHQGLTCWGNGQQTNKQTHTHTVSPSCPRELLPLGNGCLLFWRLLSICLFSH